MKIVERMSTTVTKIVLYESRADSGEGSYNRSTITRIVIFVCLRSAYARNIFQRFSGCRRILRLGKTSQYAQRQRRCGNIVASAYLSRVEKR